MQDISFNTTSKTLEGLYKSIKTYFETVKGGAIIIDNLNLLFTLSESASEVLDFLNYCYKLVSSKESSSLVVLLHDEGQEIDRLIDSLYYITPSSFSLYRIQGLESGFSREISGQV
jgi:archaellum biogenesis ATPase FlaH